MRVLLVEDDLTAARGVSLMLKSSGAVVDHTDTGEEATYRILGADESDLAKGSISITSPLARSLIGKQVGDEVKVRMPGGDRTYEILDVSFG